MLLARNLACARGSIRVLSDLSFELMAGEVLAVLGTNGAGKSTLLATLSGELAPVMGDIQLAGRALYDWGDRERATRLAVLPQASSLAFPFSVREVVALGRMPHQSGAVRDAHIVEEAMQAADVAQFASRSYLKLSGGERQRVHLARVMAQVWEGGAQCCLLLDEPTASLDMAHQQLILQQARRLAERGAAVLLVLHDLNLAARYADRLLLLHQGSMAILGKPWEVLNPARIDQVFNVRAQVVPHPSDGSPLVII